jgi:hypothetical protein
MLMTPIFAVGEVMDFDFVGRGRFALGGSARSDPYAGSS